MRLLFTVCFSLSMFLFLQSCHDDVVEEVEIIDTYTPFTIYEVDIRGLISKPNGDPITEAELGFDGEVKFSDELGYFVFEGVAADTRDAILRVTADGFLPATRRISVLSPNTITLNITLIPLPDGDSFDATDGKIINVSDQAQVTFFSNGITKDGQNFSGRVTLKSYHLAKDDKELFNKLPGDLIGIDQQQDVKVLETYGMLYAKLEDDAGNELQPDSELPAQLSIDIPQAYRAQAPDEIPMWYFDENRALWIEEGTATKVNNRYVGSVTHFSWWNIDIPLSDLITVCLKAVDISTGESLKNSNVLFISEGVEFGIQTTNNDGKLCVSLPSQKVITLSLATSCQYVSSTEIGPFDESTDNVQVELGTNEAGSISINGELSNCDGQTITADILTVSRDGKRSVIEASDNGSYSYSVVCPRNNEKLVFVAYDKATDNTVSKEYSVNADEKINQFDITVCGDDSQDILVGNIFGEELIILIDSVKLNPNETILVLDNMCYLSFLGNTTGTFEGVYFCSGNGPNSGVEVKVSIFGNQIIGTFSGNDVSGSFNASNN